MEGTYEREVEKIYGEKEMVLYRFPCCSSTIDAMKDLLSKTEEEYIAVVAERQTSGRGSGGRRWVSEPGNLYASFSFPLTAIPSWCLGYLPLFVGVSLIEALSSLPGMCEDLLKIKWPNDIVVGKGIHKGSKICGTLIEVVKGKCIVSFGVNLVSSPEDCVLERLDESEPHCYRPATSISNIVSKEYNRNELSPATVAISIINTLMHNLDTVPGPDEIRRRWTEKADWNQPVRSRSNPQVELQPLYIDAHGFIVVLQESTGKEVVLMDEYLI